MLAILCDLAACKSEKPYRLSPKLGPTMAITDITDLTARSGGEVAVTNGSPIIDKGLCWSIGLVPTLADSSKISAGPGAGSFVIQMLGLMPATTYNVWAYATNEFGTSYGKLQTFTTKNPMVPVLSIPSVVGAPKQTSVIISASVINQGGSPLIERGLCLDTTQIPTKKSLHIADYNKTTGEFEIAVPTLAGKQYFLRAYATNASGTAYSKQITFKASSGSLPSIKAPIVTINGSQVNVKVTFLSGGDFAPITKGICYMPLVPTSYGFRTLNIALPTTTVVKFKNNPDTGTFSYNVTGLIPDTTYYICSWAVNSRSPIPDTTYSNTLSFESPPAGVPVLKTMIDTIGGTNLYAVGGNILKPNGRIIEKGICYIKHSQLGGNVLLNPTAEDAPHMTIATDPAAGYFFTKISLDSIIHNDLNGFFFAPIMQLRAYAINGAGTGYGDAKCVNQDHELVDCN